MKQSAMTQATEEKPLKILQITDLHILQEAGDTMLGIDTEHYFQAIVQQAISNSHYDLVLVTGDLTQHPCLASYHRIHSELQKLHTPCLCLPGNHDDFAQMQQVFQGPDISCDKQKLLGNWQILCLNSQIPDSPCGLLSNGELEFLESRLQQNPECFAMIAVHHHCIPTNCQWMDIMQIANSAQLLELLVRYPQARAITFGHIHQDLHCKQNNLEIFAAPATCFQFNLDSRKFALQQTPPGYRIFNLYPDGRIDSEVLRLPGRLTELQMDSEGY